MPRSPEVEAWALPIVGNGATVLHLPTGTIGKAEAFYLPGAYVGPNGVPVDEYVLELATGDRFLVRGDEEGSLPFVVLSAVEVAFLDATSGELAVTLTRAIGAAAVTQDGPSPIGMSQALLLIGVALQGQLRALQQTAEGGTG